MENVIPFEKITSVKHFNGERLKIARFGEDIQLNSCLI